MMPCTRYRSPLGDIESIHWTGPENSEAVFDFMGLPHPDEAWASFCAVDRQTHQGTVTYAWGDWIVKDVDGRCCPVKADPAARSER